jgi:multiple sugar transport system substrate-binding protein
VASKIFSRRTVLGQTLGVAAALLTAACAAPASTPAAPAAAKPTDAPKAAAPAAAGAAMVTIRAHMVKKQDVSDWIETAMKQDIDGFKAKNPNIDLQLELVPGFAAEFIPKILALTAGGQLGDVTWYAPRHKSQIGWGVQFNVVRDLIPLAQAANYDLTQFYPGALDHNSFEGKQYFLSYISEPIVPVIAYNKTLVEKMGLQAPADDMTFDELLAWAKKGTTADVFGYFRGNSGNTPFSGLSYLRAWGVEPVDKAGKKATFLDSKDAFVGALKYRQDLQTAKISPRPVTPDNTNEVFGGQKLLAYDVWPFFIQILPETYKGKFDVDFVLAPTVKKGDKRRSGLNEHVFGVTTASKNPQEAFKVISWFGSKELNVQGVVQGQKGPIARPDFWADQRVFDKHPAYKKLLPIMQAIEPDFTVANFRGEEFDNAYAQVFDGVEISNTPPDAAAAEIQKLTQAVLDKDPA